MSTQQHFQYYLSIILMTCVPSIWSFEQRWDGLQNTNRVNGDPCYTPCMMRGTRFAWCNLINGWETCSEPNKDEDGHQCTSECSRTPGGTVSECQLRGRVWGACSPPVTKPSTLLPWSTSYITENNRRCVGSCQKWNSRYYRCATGITRQNVLFSHWNSVRYDDCSPKPNYNVNGTKCKTACSLTDNDEWRCEGEDGTEEKCGAHVTSSRSQYNEYGFKCVSPCITLSGGENMCQSGRYDISQPIHCSLFTGLAINNDRCTSPCDGAAGGDSKPFWQDYDWCRTAQGKKKSNFCSNSTEDPDIYASFISPAAESRVPFRQYLVENGVSPRQVRRLLHPSVYDFEDDSGRNITTIWRTDESLSAQFPQVIQDSEWSLAIDCLNVWRWNDFPTYETSSNPYLANAKDDGQNSVILEQLEPTPLKAHENASPVLHVTLRLHVKAGSGYPSPLKLIGSVRTPLALVRSNGHITMNALVKSVYVRKAVEITQLSYSDALQFISSNKALLDVTVYKVEFSSDNVKKAIQGTNKRQMTLAAREVFNNPSPITIIQRYSKSVELTETYTMAKVQSFTDLHSVHVAANFEFTIPFLKTFNLAPTYNHDRNFTSSDRESYTITRNETFTLSKTLSIPPCTTAEVSSYVSVIEQLTLDYELFMKVQAVDSLTASELQDALPHDLAYVSNFGSNSVIAKAKSHVVIQNAGIDTNLDARGRRIPNCG